MISIFKQIDRKKKQRVTLRSELLQNAAYRKFDKPDPETFDRALARGQAALAHAGSFESSKLIRNERDSRAKHFL